MDLFEIANLANRAAINEGTLKWIESKSQDELYFQINLSDDVSKPFTILSKSAKQQICNALRTDIGYRKGLIEQIITNNNFPQVDRQ